MKAAESVIEAFMGLKVDIIVQKFIKEAGGSDIQCFVNGEKVVGAMKRTAKPGEFRSNHGPVVMEVNSCSGLEGIEAATGKDIGGLIVEFLEKNAKKGRTRTRGEG